MNEEIDPVEIEQLELQEKTAKALVELEQDAESQNRVLSGQDVQNILDNAIREMDSINVEKVGSEILEWLINNVSLFVDNQKREFHINLPQESKEFHQVAKLTALYRSIPNEKEVLGKDVVERLKADKRYSISKEDQHKLDNMFSVTRTLDDIVDKVHFSMKTNPLMQKLFKEMVYFYEVSGIYKGNMIVKNLTGSATIKTLTYDKFSVPVAMTNKQTGESSVYLIPEGLALVLEIALKEEKEPVLPF